MNQTPLARWQDRTLWELRPGQEAVLASGSAYRPLTHALCLLEWEGKILLVHSTQSRQWELPGGGLQAGESAGEAALRGLFESSCQRPLEMWFRGLCCYGLGPAAQPDYGALYCGRPSQLYPFQAHRGVDQIYWWTPGEILADIHPLAAALVPCFGPEAS